MTKGRFITLEGGEGTGKTTNLAFVREFLENRGKRMVMTREPGGTPVGEKIRALFLGEGDLAGETELLLVFAARAQHLRDVILPGMESGPGWCATASPMPVMPTKAGRRLGLECIGILEEIVQRGCQPDLTLLFDAPVEIGMARAKNRGTIDRMEAETIAFHARVREAYLQLARRFPLRIKVIDASMPLAEVQSQIALHLTRLCGDDSGQ